LIGTDIYLNVIELQTTKASPIFTAKKQQQMYTEMTKYFSSEVQSGSGLHGCISVRKVKSMHKHLDTTLPVSVPAAPGFSYMQIQIVTGGNLLKHHLLVV
jgi:hypothetical protein